MKPALLSLLGTAAAFLAVVIFLNWRHGGSDEFPGGSLTEPAPGLAGDHELARLFPPEVTHACAVCGDCVHPVVIDSNRRTLKIRDHHHWFQLFKASDRTYYFGDLIALASCVHIRSARDPEGRWELSAHLGPARHPKGPPHDCGMLRDRVSQTYELVVSADPIEDSTLDADRYGIASSTQALVFRYGKPPDESLLHFGWRRAGADFGGPVARAPCACGKP